MKNSNKKAFTLVELLVVIAIIGILFVVLISKVDFATDKSKATGVQTDFRSFQLAVETVARENAGLSPLVEVSVDDNGTPSDDSDDVTTYNYDKLVAALNKNLDPKLHIAIAADGAISMVNDAKDPWKEEYTGKYLHGDDTTNRGAIIFYSNGANLTAESSATMAANGVPSVTTGADDYTVYTVYTYANGYGEIISASTGFSNNQEIGVDAQ